jgi:predicted secreted protein
MTITAALVLFSVIWFMTFLVVLPIRLVTQGDAGEIVPGTHASSPHEINLKRKAWITTGVSLALFAVIASLLVWGPWGVRDIDWFGRMTPLEEVEAR